MKSKTVLRLSFAFNIIFIAVIITVGIVYMVIYHSLAQSNQANDNLKTSDFKWPSGKKMALSFTFDDAYYSQIDSGIPIFDKYGIKTTFYVLLWRLGPRLDDWKRAAANGHEIGNHTYRHPCTANYDFIKDNSLESCSIPEMKMDLYSENEVIKEMMGFYPVSFAYPCGQTFIGKGLNTKSYVPLVSTMFESGRLYDGGFVNPASCDMAQLPSEQLDGKSFNQIKKLIETAKSTGKWLILSGHEINNEDNGASNKSAIEAICKYAVDSTNGIWIDNIHNIASYVREKRGDEPFVQRSGLKDPLHSIFSKLWSKYYLYKFKSTHHQNGATTN